MFDPEDARRELEPWRGYVLTPSELDAFEIFIYENNLKDNSHRRAMFEAVRTKPTPRYFGKPGTLRARLEEIHNLLSEHRQVNGKEQLPPFDLEWGEKLVNYIKRIDN